MYCVHRRGVYRRRVYWVYRHVEYVTSTAAHVVQHVECVVDRPVMRFALSLDSSFEHCPSSLNQLLLLTNFQIEQE